MKTTSLIQEYIKKIPLGRPFATATLAQYGSRAAVDQVLSRLARAGEITRLTRGLSVRPEKNRFIGQVLPEPFKIVEAIAKKTNEVIQVSGAEAARQFALSTQVPAQPIFLTTGRSRKFSIGSLEVTLKHVSRKKIPFPETKEGLAILALWYLGKSQANSETIMKIEKKLMPNEFEHFTSLREYMPVWMSEAVLKYRHTKV